MAKSKTPLRELLETILYALAIALLVRFFVVEVYVVDGPSMENTLYSYERLMVNKYVYRFSDPQPGDVIVFRFPGDLRGTKWPPWAFCLVNKCNDYVKRVIAVGGDTVEIRQGLVYVNGTLRAEPPLSNRDQVSRRESPVPLGSIFVMGDNRPNSKDSREFGPVELRYVKGKAALRFWPLSKWQWLGNSSGVQT